jgi:RNA polymerase sigma-54 factor
MAGDLMFHHIPFHTLRPLTTAHLAQTMTLLSLTSSELQQQIDAELSSNPALELLDEIRCPTCHRLLRGGGICPVCSRPTNQSSVDEPIVFVSTREIVSGFGSAGEDEEREDNRSAVVEDLATYVFRQIATEVAPEDRKVAAFLLTHLDEDGLLSIELSEASQYFHVPLTHVENIRKLIQKADPVGVCSSTPKQALLVQLEMLGESCPVPDHTAKIIDLGLEMISRKQFSELARMIGVPAEKVKQIAKFISENLNPFPGRSYWGDVRQPTTPQTQIYYHPDMIISRMNDGLASVLMVEILFPIWGTLRVNPLYKQVIQSADDEQKSSMREDMERASLFVKCLQQRNNTMQRLMQRIAALQREFILNGDKFLKPITRASLSKELGVHESTISRAVANKAVQLPNGKIIPLADFFDRSLSARIILKEIINEESRPLSDSELVHLLAERGYEVARRTIAKYRAMEGILPANLRRS